MNTNKKIKAPHETPLSQSRVLISEQVTPRTDYSSLLPKMSPTSTRSGRADLGRIFPNTQMSEPKRSTSNQLNIYGLNTPPLRPNSISGPQFLRKSSSKVVKNIQFADLLNKIADPGSQHVYEQQVVDESLSGSPGRVTFSDSPKKFTFKQRSQLKGTSFQTSPKSSTKSLLASGIDQSKDEFEKNRGDMDSPKEEPYKYSKLDSKFLEIQELKTRNELLMRENMQLKQDMVDVDEFDEVLKKKTKLENFNEKRCDILKACVRKQKRYIDYMNKTIRICKTFYKDMKHILDFLVQMDEKYVKSGLKVDKSVVEALETAASTQVDMADRGFVEIYKELRNTETMKRFIENFNEAYRKLKKMEESNVEIEKLFTLVSDESKPVNPITLHLHPEMRRKLKYKYMFKQFINKYNMLFPIYTVFGEFELKDKTNFSNFVEHMTLMSERIGKVFSRIKNFDMLDHTNLAYTPDISELVIKNKMEFKDYFDRKNPNKRIFLKSEEVFRVEKSLSLLLTDLINFHNNLATKKEEISIESVLGIQESLRASIEDLLLLGITTTADFSMDDKVFVVTKKNPLGGQSDFLREGYIPEKEILFELYNQEDDNLDKYQSLKNSINNLFNESMKELEKTHSESLTVTLEKLKRQVESLQINYEDMGVVSRLKDVEMNFMREYARIALKDIEKLRKFTEEKLTVVDTALKGVDTQLKDLDKSFDEFLSFSKDNKGKAQFEKKYKKAFKEITEEIQAILKRQKNSVYSDIAQLEDNFKRELEKIKKELLRNGEKIKEITIKIRKH